jgi:hypothetical protein
MTLTITKEPAAVDSESEAAEHDEFDLLLGRPWEDRSFEAVEAGAGFAAGLAIGTAVAGPVGAVVGCIVGLTGGIAAGEALERAVGRAATTTDAGDHERPDNR